MANNIKDKESEKTENKYDVESREGEIFEIIENNRYKKIYDYKGELITISKEQKIR